MSASNVLEKELDYVISKLEDIQAQIVKESNWLATLKQSEDRYTAYSVELTKAIEAVRKLENDC